MEKININFVKGDTYSKGFTIEGFELPITQVYFTVKEKSSDKVCVLQKTLNNGILLDQDIPNRYILTIEADDTNEFKTAYDYVYDIQIVSGTFKKTIVGGFLTLDDWDITSKENEV